jgi:hypothetical protein
MNFSEVVMREGKRFSDMHASRVSCSVESNLWIEGDDQMLTALVVNLIDNALKYGGKDGDVDITLNREANHVVLRVADGGIGIPQEERRKVFQKFYRSGNEETRSARGTGLGLFIVASVAKLHRAELEIMNNEPQGSIFVVRMKEVKHG